MLFSLLIYLTIKCDVCYCVTPHWFFGLTYFRMEEELTVGTRTINIIILKMYCVSSTRIVDNAGFSCIYYLHVYVVYVLIFI
jgi:hypothetical protein